MSKSRPRNAMTVDVEDYFQVSAFERYIDRDAWDRKE
ncbi:MAG: polysaccharide deacetylase family protein, partial [Sedimenticolaceae bacterium]